MGKGLPWFRLYAEIIDDEKIRLLAFEDRWHYIAILCMKGNGLLDSGDDHDLMMRKVAVKMGLAIREIDEVARRLAEVGLIDKNTLQPCKWDDRQFKSDTSTDRVRAYREKQKNQQVKPTKRKRNVSVTIQDTDTDTDKEKTSMSSGDDGQAKNSKLTEADCLRIADQYNQTLGDYLPKATTMHDSRKTAINARFQEMLNSKTPSGSIRFADKESGIEWFGKIFEKIKKNPHWIGENGWKPSGIDWFMKPANFVKVLEYRP